MTWTYGSSPTTSALDAIRLLTGDTDSAYPLLSDEEINYFLDTYSETTEAAAYTCDAIAAKFARLVTWSGDGLSVSADAVTDKYQRLAASLREQFKQASRIAGPDAAVLDTWARMPIFGIAQHDNPQAGYQWATNTTWYNDLVAHEAT